MQQLTEFKEVLNHFGKSEMNITFREDGFSLSKLNSTLITYMTMLTSPYIYKVSELGFAKCIIQEIQSDTYSSIPLFNKTFYFLIWLSYISEQETSKWNAGRPRQQCLLSLQLLHVGTILTFHKEKILKRKLDRRKKSPTLSPLSVPMSDINKNKQNIKT